MSESALEILRRLVAWSEDADDAHRMAVQDVRETISQLTKELEEAREELRRMKALAMSFHKELDKLTICRCGHSRDLHSADMTIGEGKMSHGAFRCLFGEGCDCADYESGSRPKQPSVGDGPCERCEQGNPAVWFVSPHERWNEVMGSPAGMLCPNCFFALVQERGFDDGTRCWAIIREDERELAWQERWEHGRSVGRDELQKELDALRDNQETAWAAGLYEGEGTVFIHNNARPDQYPKTRMGLRITDEDVIRHFREAVGSGSVVGPYPNHQGHPGPPEKYKPVWQWSLNNLDEIKAIRDRFWPFLGARRREQMEVSIAGNVVRPPHNATNHTCECGRVIRGNAIAIHHKKCEVHNGL